MIRKLFCVYNRNLIKRVESISLDPIPFQEAALQDLLQHGKDTEIGRLHNITSISDIGGFQSSFPLRTYDQIEPFIKKMLNGQNGILWDQKIPWFALSSGTSSAKSKFIPISPSGLKSCHLRGMQMMLSYYLSTHPHSKLFHGKTLTLGGSRHIDSSVESDCLYGDLSAFLMLSTPGIARHFATPPKKVAMIPDFVHKMGIISNIIQKQRLTAFAGVPSWNLILMQQVLEQCGKENLHQLWPSMELFMHGGVNFEPYRQQFRNLFPGEQMHFLENYNASEGFFAFQDDLSLPGMLLLPDNGVFYEFIPFNRLEEAQNGTFTAFDTLDTVEVGKNYAMVISTNSGLWRYLLGDTVKFISVYPHRIVITGRIQAFINTFGEELMVQTAERALTRACEQTKAIVNEFTVAPVFMTDGSKGRHEWVIEFSKSPLSMEDFSQILDRELCALNSDYEAKRLETGTMDRQIVFSVEKGTFFRWMQQNSKLGGQNKVPRLCNERTYVNALKIRN